MSTLRKLETTEVYVEAQYVLHSYFSVNRKCIEQFIQKKIPKGIPLQPDLNQSTSLFFICTTTLPNGAKIQGYHNEKRS